jgi:hypothetical protein
MPSSHDEFKVLGPIDWESFTQEDPKTLMTDIFSDAHCLVDSIPVSLEDESKKTARTRAATDTDLPSLPSRTPKSTDRARELRKEWKEVKINARENPLSLNVYKLAAKDGRGAWFARRSIHEGLSFERWKTGMEREFAESLKVQGTPGSGKIRGLGADKRVVDQTVDGCGRIQGKSTVYYSSLLVLLVEDKMIDQAMSQSISFRRSFQARPHPATSSPCV